MEKKISKKQNSYSLSNAQIKVNSYLIFLFSELPVGRFSEKPLPVTLGQSKVPPGSVSFLLMDQYREPEKVGRILAHLYLCDMAGTTCNTDG